MHKLNSYCIESQHLEKYFTDIILLVVAKLKTYNKITNLFHSSCDM